MSSSTTTSIHPIYGQPLPISTSLTSDAPGHSSASVADPKGVICWKCLGSGNVGGRLSGSKKPKKACPVCEKGRLKTKALRSSPGTVRKVRMRGRKCSLGGGGRGGDPCAPPGHSFRPRPLPPRAFF